MGLFFVSLVYLGAIEGLGLLFPFNLIFFIPPLSRFLFLLLSGGLVLIFLSTRREIEGLDWLLENFERSKDRKRFPGKGAFFYTLSAFILALFTNSEVLAASISILAIGDSFSFIIGQRFGKVKHPCSRTKNIEGNIAGGILGGLVASLFVEPLFAFSASLIAMFIEGIELEGVKNWVLEDNFIVPLVSGIVIVILRFLF